MARQFASGPGDFTPPYLPSIDGELIQGPLLKAVADGAATLTAFTVEAIVSIVPHLPKAPTHWIVAGGGARNLMMMRLLRHHLAPARVETADALGWAGDALEAQAFAFLAARSLQGLPLSYPATTGVPAPTTGGIIARP